MDFKEYLELYNAQAKIDKLAKLYKNKKIAIYGAGQFAKAIFDNYDVSKLNIVAVADIRFEKEKNANFFGYNCIAPRELGYLDCDVILIANYDTSFFTTLLDDQILYLTPNENVTIRPMIKETFFDLFFKKPKQTKTI